MAEFSGFWTTDDTTAAIGHQVAEYSQAHWKTAAQILAACSGKEGVAPNFLNNLSCTSPALETVRVNTGAALVDGKWYLNDSTVDLNVPKTTVPGNTRIDRIALVCTWADFEVVLTVVSGSEGGTPSAPSLPSTPNSEYAIPLYQALVDYDGNITLTNERLFAKVSVDDSTIEWPGNANSLRVKDDGITNAKLRNSAALSVIGRASNSTGDPADITAGTDNYVLRRSGTTLAFGQVATDGIASGSVTLEKMAANSVDSDQYVDGSIDQEHLSNGASKVTNRQGGNGGAWATAGDTNYTPSNARIQVGSQSGSMIETVTFPASYSNTPVVVVSPADISIFTAVITAVSASDFTVRCYNSSGNGVSGIFYWIAIGPA